MGERLAERGAADGEDIKTYEFSLTSGGEAFVWTAHEGRTGVARVEQTNDSVSITWSTSWSAKDVHSLLSATPHREPSPNDVARIAAASEFDALLVLEDGRELKTADCAELLEKLVANHSRLTFIRAESNEAAFVWTRETRLHGWHGASIGIIVERIYDGYVPGLIRKSATKPITEQAEAIVAAAR